VNLVGGGPQPPTTQYALSTPADKPFKLMNAMASSVRCSSDLLPRRSNYHWLRSLRSFWGARPFCECRVVVGETYLDADRKTEPVVDCYLS
jgi:hypothetical protein